MPRLSKIGPVIAHVFSDEESKTRRTYLVSKAEERRVDKPSRESKKPSDTKPAESFREEKGAAKRQWPSSEVGGRTLPKPDVYLRMRRTGACGGVLVAGGVP